MLSNYVPLVAMGLLGFGFAVFSVLLATIVGPKRYNKAKYDPYECGIEPVHQPMGGGRFPIKFYLTAMLFIIFDVEMIFLYPFAVSIDMVAWFGLVQIFVFIGAVTIAYAYEWRRGGLDWN